MTTSDEEYPYFNTYFRGQYFKLLAVPLYVRVHSPYQQNSGP